jgi:hypothetical protein
MKTTLIFISFLVQSLCFAQLASWNNGSFKEMDNKSANNLKMWNEGNQFNYEEVSRNQNANGEVEVILNDLNGRSGMQVRLTNNTSYWKYQKDVNWNVLYSGSWAVKPSFSMNVSPSTKPNNPISNEENCDVARNKYLELNLDVKNARIDPWAHYQNYGKKEGRKWPSCQETNSNTNANNQKSSTPVYNPNVNSTVSQSQQSLNISCYDYNDAKSTYIGKKIVFPAYYFMRKNNAYYTVIKKNYDAYNTSTKSTEKAELPLNITEFDKDSRIFIYQNNTSNSYYYREVECASGDSFYIMIPVNTTTPPVTTGSVIVEGQIVDGNLVTKGVGGMKLTNSTVIIVSKISRQ